MIPDNGVQFAHVIFKSSRASNKTSRSFEFFFLLYLTKESVMTNYSSMALIF